MPARVRELLVAAGDGAGALGRVGPAARGHGRHASRRGRRGHVLAGLVKRIAPAHRGRMRRAIREAIAALARQMRGGSSTCVSSKGRSRVVTGASRGIGRAIAVALGRARRQGGRQLHRQRGGRRRGGRPRCAAAGGTARRQALRRRRRRRGRRGGQGDRRRRGRRCTSWSTTPASPSTALVLGAQGRRLEARARRQPDRRLPLLPRGAARAAEGARTRAASSTSPRSSARCGTAGQAPYVAAKAGLIGLTKTLARSSRRAASPSTPCRPASSRPT